MIKVSGKYVNMMFGTHWILHDKYFLVKREEQAKIFQFNAKFEKSIAKMKGRNFVIKNSTVLGNSELSSWIDTTLHMLVDLVEQARRNHKVTPVFRSGDIVQTKKFRVTMFYSKDKSIKVGIDFIYDIVLQKRGIDMLYYVDKKNIPLFTEGRDIFISDIDLYGGAHMD